jgi:CheY-like chemotaxis protein/HPt (histidine-containing phosphotransfer) domain-containing protein
LEQPLKNGTGSVILIADDEPVNQRVFSLILKKLGYDSIIAGDGVDALEKARTVETALAFLDIMIPKMGGFEAARNLRGCGYKKPIIAVTATPLPDDEENCKKSGINDVLVKPITLPEIQGMLEKWIAAKTELPQKQRERSSVHASGQAAFNAKEMLYAFMNEEETVLPLLSRFIERTCRQLENFPVLKSSGNWADARHDAHIIKGTASSMGGRELGKAAGILELACINASAEEAETAYPLVLEAFEKFKIEAEEFILNRKLR